MLELVVIWKKPHISKIYEALTAIADNRIQISGNNKARCYSSSKNKYYEIEFDPKTNSIMSNDNTAFYKNTISYPMIAYLMMINRIAYDKKVLVNLKDIHWKDINQKVKNNYDLAIQTVLNDLKIKGVDVNSIETIVENIYTEVNKLKLSFLGTKKRPPSGY